MLLRACAPMIAASIVMGSRNPWDKWGGKNGLRWEHWWAPHAIMVLLVVAAVLGAARGPRASHNIDVWVALIVAIPAACKVAQLEVCIHLLDSALCPDARTKTYQSAINFATHALAACAALCATRLMLPLPAHRQAPCRTKFSGGRQPTRLPAA